MTTILLEKSRGYTKTGFFDSHHVAASVTSGATWVDCWSASEPGCIFSASPSIIGTSNIERYRHDSDRARFNSHGAHWKLS